MKFELTAETKIVFGIKLFRIRALKAIAQFDVKVGDLGGWVEKENNLSQDGDAWVSGNAMVYGDAWVYGDGDVMWFKNTWSSGRWFTYTRSNRMWRVGCFYGTGEELIAKAYKDSKLSGKCYEAVVRAQEAINRAIEAEKGETK